jgi:hypothetical protein
VGDLVDGVSCMEWMGKGYVNNGCGRSRDFVLRQGQIFGGVRTATY